MHAYVHTYIYSRVWGVEVLVYEAFKLLVCEALSYWCMRLKATIV
jgi:hypothetical protein